ncbi:MAG TPA: carbon monoxide dehydrogenase subunit G [Thermoleophilia bacterium]|nr:carbon monoxide dehydrogenase subunit G [Thermoleophilia bacterium]
MRFEGKINISAPRPDVWAFLTDANAVGHCMPGLESIEIITPNEKFRAVGALGLGTVKLKMNTDVEWVELEAPNRAKMKMKGTAPGSAIDVASEMHLADGPDGSTDMEWSAEVKVLGTIASLAARLMKPVTQKLTGQFFSCVKKRIEK